MGIGQPHDRFFKALMSQRGVAEALLRERLPRALSEKLRPGEPQRVAASFVDEELQVALADRLFRVAAEPPLPADIYCLIEAKAARETRSPLQALRYMVRVWIRLDRDSGSTAPLPPIIPLLVYSGRERWRSPTRFIELVQPGGIPGVDLLDFGYTVVDIGRIADAELSAHPTLRAGLMALKYAKRLSEQRGKVNAVLQALAATSGEFQQTALIYILETYRRVRRKTLLEAARRIFPTGERIVQTAAEQLRAEGRREGRREGKLEGKREGKREGRLEGKLEGKQEGKQEGEALVVMRLLERRFGPIPNARVKQIRGAAPADLVRWAERLLDAPDLDAVFAARSPTRKPAARRPRKG